MFVGTTWDKTHEHGWAHDLHNEKQRMRQDFGEFWQSVKFAQDRCPASGWNVLSTLLAVYDAKYMKRKQVTHDALTTG